MLYDIITIALVVILTVIGVKNGIAKTLLSILTAVISIVASVFVARFLSGFIFDIFFRQSITDSVNSVLNQSNINDALATAASVLSVFPAFIMSILGYFGVDTKALENTFADTVKAQGTNAADDIVGLMRSPICAVISVVLVIVLFIVFGAILGYLARKIERVFHLPVIRSFNRLFGGILGFCEGLLCIFAISFMMRLILPLVTADIYIFSEDYINTSYLFRFIYNGSLSGYIEQTVYDLEIIRKA